MLTAYSLRIMLYIYTNQSCVVKWNGTISNQFPVNNGVRQGAVSSAILFSIYIDDLIQLLKKSRLGCHIDGVYFGAFIYADDILLLSASRTGLQSVVDIYVNFTKKKNLKFGTNLNPAKSKTKCIAFSKKSSKRKNLLPVKLEGLPLPWVQKVSHLGCVLDSENSMKPDIALKGANLLARLTR